MLSVVPALFGLFRVVASTPSSIWIILGFAFQSLLSSCAIFWLVLSRDFWRPSATFWFGALSLHSTLIVCFLFSYILQLNVTMEVVYHCICTASKSGWMWRCKLQWAALCTRGIGKWGSIYRRHRSTPYDWTRRRLLLASYPHSASASLATFRSVPVNTRMWANAQRDGRHAKHRWHPLFNAAKFGLRPLLDAVQ